MDTPDQCPFHDGSDRRKTAAMAAERVHPKPGARIVDRYASVRETLRRTDTTQGAFGAGRIVARNQQTAPVIYLNGEAHKRRRSTIARFFTPKAISTRYQQLIETTTERLLSRLRQDGRAHIDRMSFELAVAIGADIIGITESDARKMAKRIETSLALTLGETTKRPRSLGRLLALVRAGYHFGGFYLFDVLPAIKARKKARQEDIISQLLDEGYSSSEIMIECITYAAAGMVTTREFITMAAWHLLTDASLKDRFSSANESDQIAILEEILRVEPVASMLYRQTGSASRGAQDGSDGELIALSIRAANMDEEVTGPCPHVIDPDRGKRTKQGSYLSFGDGSHRCPGAQLALKESRIFLDRLLKIPNLRLVREPDLLWQEEMDTYELRNALVECSDVERHPGERRAGSEPRSILQATQ